MHPTKENTKEPQREGKRAGARQNQRTLTANTAIWVEIVTNFWDLDGEYIKVGNQTTHTKREDTAKDSTTISNTGASATLRGNWSSIGWSGEAARFAFVKRTSSAPFSGAKAERREPLPLDEVLAVEEPDNDDALLLDDFVFPLRDDELGTRRTCLLILYSTHLFALGSFSSS